MRNVDAIKTRLFSGERASRRVDLEILAAAIKLGETNRERPLDHAERSALIAQRDHAHHGVFREPNEVTRVELQFEPAVFRGSEGVAFDDRVIQLNAFPVFAVGSLYVRLARDQADADDARFNVVIVRLIVVVGGAGGDGDGE